METTGMRVKIPETPALKTLKIKVAAPTSEDLGHYVDALNKGRREKLTRDEVIDYMLSDYMGNDTVFRRYKKALESGETADDLSRSQGANDTSTAGTMAA